jgi:hypothetical protein
MITRRQPCSIAEQYDHYALRNRTFAWWRPVNTTTRMLQCKFFFLFRFKFPNENCKTIGAYYLTKKEIGKANVLLNLFSCKKYLNAFQTKTAILRKIKYDQIWAASLIFFIIQAWEEVQKFNGKIVSIILSYFSKLEKSILVYTYLLFLSSNVVVVKWSCQTSCKLMYLKPLKRRPRNPGTLFQ